MERKTSSRFRCSAATPKTSTPDSTSRRTTSGAAARAACTLSLVPSIVVGQRSASTFGRYLVAAFTAVAFAGEYGWNTWKLVVPHRARWALMAAKYATVVGLIYIALALTGVLTVVLGYLGSMVTGDRVPEGITMQALLQAHGRGALLMLAPVLLTVAYTSLASVLTRSTIAALIIAVVIGTAEEVFTKFAPLLALQARDLVLFLYHVLPGHHLMNLGAWVVEGKAASRPFLDNTIVSLPWGTSLAALITWIGGLTALTVGLFQRQDLN